VFFRNSTPLSPVNETMVTYQHQGQLQGQHQGQVVASLISSSQDDEEDGEWC